MKKIYARPAIFLIETPHFCLCAGSNTSSTTDYGNQSSSSPEFGANDEDSD